MSALQNEVAQTKDRVNTLEQNTPLRQKVTPINGIVDLSIITSVGVYYFDSVASYTNKPAEMQQANYQADVIEMQVLNVSNNAKLYNLTNGTSWSGTYNTTTQQWDWTLDTQEARKNGFDVAGDPNVAISFNSTTKTLTVTHTNSIFWIDGIQFRRNQSDSISIPSAEQATAGFIHFYYIIQNDIPVLTQSRTFDENCILRYCYVANLLYTPATSSYVLYDEKHGCDMDSRTHLYNHLYNGFAYINGLLPATAAAAGGDGTNINQAQIITTSGVCMDEDNTHTIAAHNAGDAIDIYYKTGSQTDPTWNVFSSTSGAIVKTDATTGRAVFNEKNNFNVYQLTAVPNNNYLIVYLIATNAYSASQKLAIMLGENSYTTIKDARDVVTKYPIFGSFPAQEIKFLAAFILQTSNSFTNPVKSTIQFVNTDLNSFVDLRNDYHLQPATSSDLVLAFEKINSITPKRNIQSYYISSNNGSDNNINTNSKDLPVFSFNILQTLCASATSGTVNFANGSYKIIDDLNVLYPVDFSHTNFNRKNLSGEGERTVFDSPILYTGGNGQLSIENMQLAYSGTNYSYSLRLATQYVDASNVGGNITLKNLRAAATTKPIYIVGTVYGFVALQYLDLSNIYMYFEDSTTPKYIYADNSVQNVRLSIGLNWYLVTPPNITLPIEWTGGATDAQHINGIVTCLRSDTDYGVYITLYNIQGFYLLNYDKTLTNENNTSISCKQGDLVMYLGSGKFRRYFGIKTASLSYQTIGLAPVIGGVAYGSERVFSKEGTKWVSNFAKGTVWKQNEFYQAGDLVLSNYRTYIANNDIPYNTAFVIGTAGATWTETSPTFNLNSVQQQMVAFSMISTATQQAATANQKITYTSAPINIGGGADLTNNQFKAPVSGYYWISFRALANGSYTAFLYLNGNKASALSARYVADALGSAQTPSGIIYLNAGDTIDMRIESISNTVFSTNDVWIAFSGHLIPQLTMVDSKLLAGTTPNSLTKLGSDAQTLTQSNTVEDANGNLIVNGSVSANNFTYRNALANGSMLICQRYSNIDTVAQTIPLNGTGKVLDNYKIFSYGASVSVQRVTSGNSKWLRVNGAAGSTTVYVRQCVEPADALRFVGKNAVHSMKVKSSIARTIHLYCNRFTNYDDSGSMTSISVQVINVPAGESYIDLKLTNLPNEIANGFECGLSLFNLTSGTFDITDVQFEEGTVRTTFERLPYDVELRRCMRRYETGVVWGEGGSTSANYPVPIGARFAVQKRAVPTMSFSVVTGAGYYGQGTRGVYTDCYIRYYLVNALGSYLMETFTADSEY